MISRFSLLLFLALTLNAAKSDADSQRVLYLAVSFEQKDGEYDADKTFTNAVKEIDSTVEVVTLHISSLDKLGEAINKLNLNSAIDGILFSGHGNEEQFIFSDKEFYGGDDFARVLSIGLKDIKFNPRFTLILNACLTACSLPSGKGFQDRLILALPNLLNKNGVKIDELTVLGHLAPTNPLRTFSRSNLISIVLHRMGLLTKVDRFITRFTPRHPLGPAFIRALPIFAGTALGWYYAPDVARDTAPHWLKYVYAGSLLMSTAMFFEGAGAGRLVRATTWNERGTVETVGFMNDELPNIISKKSCSKMLGI